MPIKAWIAGSVLWSSFHRPAKDSADILPMMVKSSTEVCGGASILGNDSYEGLGGRGISDMERDHHGDDGAVSPLDFNSLDLGNGVDAHLTESPVPNDKLHLGRWPMKR